MIHRWVGEERAAFWGMNGLTQAQVAEIYAHMDTASTFSSPPPDGTAPAPAGRWR